MTELERAKRVIQRLNSALASIESRCGHPQTIYAPTVSPDRQRIQDIYVLAKDALEDVGVPSSPLYWSQR